MSYFQKYIKLYYAKSLFNFAKKWQKLAKVQYFNTMCMYITYAIVGMKCLKEKFLYLRVLRYSCNSLFNLSKWSLLSLEDCGYQKCCTWWKQIFSIAFFICSFNDIWKFGFQYVLIHRCFQSFIEKKEIMKALLWKILYVLCNIV